jgi:hypothetical protein
MRQAVPGLPDARDQRGSSGLADIERDEPCGVGLHGQEHELVPGAQLGDQVGGVGDVARRRCLHLRLGPLCPFLAGHQLLLDGVDEKAKVWVNGHLIGISPGAAFLPGLTAAVASISNG